MRYRYYICDVFTEIRFGGNRLAVMPEAEGLDRAQMQQVAREFNFSETAFVFPADFGHTRKIRIFTPRAEIPFAGHPNIGTAFVLAATGEAPVGSSATLTFEEGAGLVTIRVEQTAAQTIWCELHAPEPLSLGKTITADRIASVVSLGVDEVVVNTHAPRVASVGLPFTVVEILNRNALRRARPNIDVLHALTTEGIPPDVYVYVRSADEFDIRARMFAPLDGIPEDPATGSAACALAGLLTHCKQTPSGSFKWRIAQGVEMGRPSLLNARAEKKKGRVSGTWVGGACAMVSEGEIEVD